MGGRSTSPSLKAFVLAKVPLEGVRNSRSRHALAAPAAARCSRASRRSTLDGARAREQPSAMDTQGLPLRTPLLLCGLAWTFAGAVLAAVARADDALTVDFSWEAPDG